MKPATQFFLTIHHGQLAVIYDGTHGGRVTRTIPNLEDMAQFFTSKANEAGRELHELTYLSSSSLDFPEEYTENQDVIDMANAIRGA